MIDQKPFEGDSYIGNELIKLRDQFAIVNCCETGTQYGTTTKELCNIFDYVITIEADEEYYETALGNLFDHKAIVCLGKSEQELKRMKFADNILFYLDAHGCEIGGCPLKKELTILAEKKFKNICIAIHDFKVPDKDFGFDTYDYELCYEEIEEHLKLIYPKGFDYHYNTEADGARRGIVYIYPKTNDHSKVLCQIGDWVRIIGNKHGNKFSIGETVQITYVHQGAFKKSCCDVYSYGWQDKTFYQASNGKSKWNILKCDFIKL